MICFGVTSVLNFRRQIPAVFQIVFLYSSNRLAGVEGDSSLRVRFKQHFHQTDFLIVFKNAQCGKVSPVLQNAFEPRLLRISLRALSLTT